MNQLLPILYSFRRCPYAIRARMALAYSQIDYELREVSLKNKPEAMRSISAKATVPLLQLADGKVIDESLDIIQWALASDDPEHYYSGLSARLVSQVDKLIECNDSLFKPVLDKYKYADRHPQYSMQHYREQGCQFLDKLEMLLTSNRYLLSDRQCLADIAIFPFIRQFAFVDKDWFDQMDKPNLQRWLSEFLDSNLFNEVMQKHALWQPEDFIQQ